MLIPERPLGRCDTLAVARRWNRRGRGPSCRPEPTLARCRDDGRAHTGPAPRSEPRSSCSRRAHRSPRPHGNARGRVHERSHCVPADLLFGRSSSASAPQSARIGERSERLHPWPARAAANTPRRSFRGLRMVIVIVVGLLTTRLFYIQVVSGGYYAGLAQDARARPSRSRRHAGLIYDRAGQARGNQCAFVRGPHQARRPSLHRSRHSRPAPVEPAQHPRLRTSSRRSTAMPISASSTSEPRVRRA